MSLAVTVRTTPPRDKATLAPASAVPVIATLCSLALTVSSPATLEMTGASGATVSTVIARVPGCDVLPAASVAVADRVCGPWPIAAMSADCSV